MDYYSYGKILREYDNGQGDRYLTTQHERDQKTGLDYRGARYYDSDIARFLSIDPMASKYPTLSTYVYVGNNPIVFVDPTGKVFVVYRKVKDESTGEIIRQKIIFNGTTAIIQNVDKKNNPIGNPSEYKSGNDKFVDDLISSYNYIVDNDADVDGAMRKIATMDKEIEVKYSKEYAEYDAGSQDKILIDFHYSLEIYDEDGYGDNHLGNQSPALTFWSEVYHAYIDLIDKTVKESFKNDTPQRTKEEDYVHVQKADEVIDILKDKDENNNETKRPTYGSANGGHSVSSPTGTN